MSIKQRILSRLPYDERTRFHDLSKVPFSLRKPKSKVLNFYSSVDNIGNFTPILGIQVLLKEEYDVWCCHDKNIDWEFINNNYQKIIIGGAGLFHESFTNFWIQFTEKCKLPAIIWGVGGIFPKDDSLMSNVNKEILHKALKKCALINVRDTLSANLIDITGVHISPCPTIAYLNNLPKIKKRADLTLYSSHEELLNTTEKENIRNILNNKISYTYTDNIQYNYCGLKRIIKQYQRANLVITTRLHGAIIAYGLGIPYITISFDKKIEEFHRQYGNGILVKDIDALQEINDIKGEMKRMENVQPDLSYVIEFSKMASKWLND